MGLYVKDVHACEEINDLDLGRMVEIIWVFKKSKEQETIVTSL